MFINPALRHYETLLKHSAREYDFVNKLPADITFKIIEYLNVLDFLICCMVTKSWRDYLTALPILKSLAKSQFRVAFEIFQCNSSYDPEDQKAHESWFMAKAFQEVRRQQGLYNSMKGYPLFGCEIEKVAYHSGRVAFVEDPHTVKITTLDTGNTRKRVFRERYEVKRVYLSTDLLVIEPSRYILAF